MTFTKLNRLTHNWLSVFIALPILLILITGLLLVLKKDFDWIQPPSQRGEILTVPALSLTEIFAKVTSVPQAQNLEWHQFNRIDFKPSKGIVKFVTPDDWEIQIDPSTGEILSVKIRRSDFIESLHDGSYFGASTKYFLSVPAGISLFVLSLSGLYMFFLPIVKKRHKRKLLAKKIF